MTYIVHGATGAQGAPVLSALLSAGLPARAAVRDTSKLTDVDAVSIDVGSVDSLVAAYEGAEGVFVHLPIGSPDDQRRYALAIGEAIRRAQPARVVFSTSGYSIDPAADGEDAPNVLAREIAASGVSYAIVEPRLYLENLLLPPMLAAAREGTLPYPLRDDYVTSWSSHLDVADVVVRLLTSRATTGIVSVGALPGLVGADLAAGFAGYFGHEVTYEAISPQTMGEMIEPLFGSDSTAPIVASYAHRDTQTGEEIPEARSAQALLGTRVRSVEEWLRAMAV
ncbi:SDR family oxidoreductase [Microbacterium aurantiacum]|uniref:SDR family oxidoreductase n=1 Tax=Microbacterium aurantiacum TaxID=162393 RepID=UPI000C802CEA|nr:NAD(P)H-binding protein [Microbacterium aurantiacum]